MSFKILLNLLMILSIMSRMASLELLRTVVLVAPTRGGGRYAMVVD